MPKAEIAHDLDAVRVERGYDALVAAFDRRHGVAAAQIVDAFEPDHWVRPESPSTSRLSRSVAAWPEAAGKVTGLTTRLPPIASLTTLTLLP